MPDSRGRICKREHLSFRTEFKVGRHWRSPKPWWNSNWLHAEYIGKQRSASEIAITSGCTENNILYWLNKHGIPRRSICEARVVKSWAVSGAKNGMYGRTGATSPQWRGGITAERQALYASSEWATVVKRVWKRDAGLCQHCGQAPKHHFQFHIHHQISFAVVNLRTRLDNLVLLCRSCHHWTHSKKNVRGLFILKGGDA